MEAPRVQTYVKYFSVPSEDFIGDPVKFAKALQDLKEFPVESRDPCKLRIPHDAYAFKFFDRTEVTVDCAGVPKVARTDMYNESSYYYPDGEVIDASVAQIKYASAKDFAQITRIVDHGSRKLIRTRFGRFVAHEEGDVVFSTK